MALSRSELKNIIYAYIRKLKKKIKVEKVILFGSYAYGKPWEGSDIDLAIISSEFKNMDDIERIMLLSDLARDIAISYPIDIDPLGFTSREIENANYFDITGEIKEKGKVTYTSKK